MKKRILLVDDLEIIRLGLRRTVSRHYEVCGEAADGQEAIQKATELKPDLIILDSNMPVMDGFTAACKIRQLLPAAKIVMLSDDFQPETEAKEAGADAIVAKARPLDELSRAIDRCLERTG
jgi:CheY-like chemotaxis protein